MPPQPPPATRYAVKRFRWISDYRGQLSRLPGEVTVATFPTIDEADADRRKREEEVRKQVNPFNCGDALHYRTHLDAPRLHDWLLDHGIDPPKPNKDGEIAWATWWSKAHKKLSAEKQAAVWEALDKVRFFTVVEELAGPVGYAVVGVGWSYNDEFYDADAEGGRLVKVFRTRERAEEECAARNAVERENWGDMLGDFDFDDLDDDEVADMGMFDMQDRLRLRNGLLDRKQLKRGEGVFRDATSVPFYEIIEIPLEGLE